ncbi:hypothetical protein ABIA60_000220 [Pseudomonas frederiksbergensis]
MTPPCLICESVAVLTQDNAKAIVQLLTVFNGFIREWPASPPPDNVLNPREPIPWLLTYVTQAIERAAVDLHASTAFIQDIQTYQFGTFTCLCLRCGARFDPTNP